MDGQNDENSNKRRVELAFPRFEQEDNDTEYISKGGKGEGLARHLFTSIDEITDWFKQYQVESIELWISGLVEASGVTRLVVSAKGEGGLRVVLKPKSLDDSEKL